MAVPGSLRARSLVGILPVVVGWTPCDCPSALAQPANGHLRCTVPSRGAARPGISRRKTGLARRATVRGEARPGIPPYFLPAAEASEIPASITVHGLRHAHAAWLLAGGADLEVVKERLGHSSIVTTQKYLGAPDETDETAMDALGRIRSRSKKPSSPSRRRSA